MGQRGHWLRSYLSIEQSELEVVLAHAKDMIQPPKLRKQQLENISLKILRCYNRAVIDEKKLPDSHSRIQFKMKPPTFMSMPICEGGAHTPTNAILVLS